MSSSADTLLACENIAVRFRVKRKRDFTAVQDATIHIKHGEITGLVGESGSGKTTLGLVVAGMVSPNEGTVRFAGKEISLASPAQMQEYRRNVQMVFQDPAGALNPRITIGEVLHEVLYVHRHALDLCHHAERDKRCLQLLDAVGLSRSLLHRYPHALSGGQRQRVGIARALALKPKLLVADEPVSALDVSVQVQILNLLRDVSAQLGQACLFIAHDLAVVRYMCERAYVMESGKIVESGTCQKLFSSPSHPYTRKLLEAVPDVEKGIRARKMSQHETK